MPHLFTAADGSPVMAFAGIWDRWRDKATGEDILSATVLVTGATAWMTPYHDRMPVILMPEQFDAWLSGTGGPEMLQPAAETTLQEWIVSSRVNTSGQDDDSPSLIEPAA